MSRLRDQPQEPGKPMRVAPKEEGPSPLWFSVFSATSVFEEQRDRRMNARAPNHHAQPMPPSANLTIDCLSPQTPHTIPVSPMRRFARAILLLPLAVSLPASAAVPPEQQAAIDHFERNIRPVLIETCQKCHGPGKARNGLRLDSRAAILKGGESGPAIRPGNAKGSLLFHALTHSEELKMPPDGKLDYRTFNAFVKWIDDGAIWPGQMNDDDARTGSPTENPVDDGAPIETDFWSFQPIANPAPPTVNNADWPRTSIDRFILHRLNQAGLQPAPAADRRTLIRRLHLDLTGLPPTPQQMRRALNDPSPRAMADLIDQLLASPQYGERWGRHWLDIARYADSNGLDENMAYPSAWRYRDYVIRAFNEDKPYDQFLIEQLAGDLLPRRNDPDREVERYIATGFLAIGPKMLACDDPDKMRRDIVDDQIDTIGRALMGLSLGCGRCHDHKFDPFPTSDYYGLAGIFLSTETVFNYKVVAKWVEHELPPYKSAPLRNELAKLRAEKAPLDKLIKDKKPLSPDQKKRRDELDSRIAELKTALAAMPTGMIVRDKKIADAAIHIRGNYLTLGETIPRRTPRAFASVDPPDFDNQQSGRLQLARWLTDPGHPLTARVIANRIWQQHFGRGLVASPDNFGSLGSPPSHPELLDHLASHLIQSGWSIKSLHRLILNSATYQMAAAANSKAERDDPKNTLYWSWEPRRLEAEAIRDSILSVSGRLDPRPAGKPLDDALYKYVNKGRLAGRFEAPIRSVYLPTLRSNPFDGFAAFDFADASVVVGQRTTSTVAPQALFMMNSDLVHESSVELAEEVLRKTPDSTDHQIEAAYQACLTRSPSEMESRAAAEFIARYKQELRTENNNDQQKASIAALARALFASNEFVYLR